jgi:hypothetical protein
VQSKNFIRDGSVSPTIETVSPVPWKLNYNELNNETFVNPPASPLIETDIRVESFK